MAENIIARCSGWLKLDPVEDVWVNGMFHNICGPVMIGIFRGEFAENAKMEGGKTNCNMIIEADENNGVLPAYELRLSYLEDKTSVEYKPVYSDKDDRFVQEYRFDVSKLEPSFAKVCASITNRNLPGRMGHKKTQIYSPHITAASAFTHLCYKVNVEL